MGENRENDHTEQRIRKRRFLYPLESDRQKRIDNFHFLLSKYDGEALPEGRLPAMLPWAWIKAPTELYSSFLCSKHELHLVGEMHVATIVVSTAKEPSWIALDGVARNLDGISGVTMTSRSPSDTGEVEEEVTFGSLDDDPTAGLEPYGLDEDLKYLTMSKMKFVVYVTAELPHQILEEFLALAPHSHFAEHADKDDVSWRPYTPGAWDNAAWLLKTETPLEQVTMRTTLPVNKDFHSPFIGKSADEVVSDFVRTCYRLKSRRHLFSSHCFVALDEQTAKDHCTASIWSDSSGHGWESRRCEFEALLYNLHPLETLKMGLHQLCSKDDMLTVESMEAEREMARQDRRERGYESE